jgi:hypothetical protein
VANVENFCSTRFHPHWGHSGGSGLRVNTSFSKTCPQLEQAYSKIGMAKQAHFLGLMSQLSCLEFPAGEARRRAQVKREIPGMRGRTRNQTTRKRTKIKKLSIGKILLIGFRTRRLLHDGQDSSFNFLCHRAEIIRMEQLDQ